MTITYFLTGANRGIGFELAKQLSADSNNVVIATTRSFANATDLQDLNRSNLHVIEYDITAPLEQMKKALVDSLEKYAPDGIDVIIQNAGMSKNSKKCVIETTEEELKDHYLVNTIGPIKVYQSTFPYWSQNQPGNCKKNRLYEFRSWLD